MKSKVYFQSGFWKSINSNTSVEGIRSKLNVSDALSSSLVITDVQEEMIKEDFFLKILIKKGNYIRCDEKYIEKKLNSINSEEETIEHSEDLCATYILDKTSSECAKIEHNLGVVTLCPGSLQHKEYLFKGEGFTLDKKHKYELRYMTFKSKLQHPCNSLIILDPYLLSKKKIDEANSITFPGILNNLESLINAILPQTLDIDFHLTIISNLEDGQNDVKRAYEKVKKCLKRIRKDLTIKFGFFYTEKGYDYKVESFHSRHVISNSFMIDSEDGLDLFGDKGFITKNNPTVSIVYPRLFGNSRQDMTKYDNWVRSVKNFIEEASEESFCGTKYNRLLDLNS